MRYFRATLLCGFVAALTSALLYQFGVFARVDRQLADFLGARAGIIALPSAVQFFAIVLFAFGIAWTTIDIIRVSLKLVVAIGAFLEVMAMVWVLNLYHRFFSPFPSATAIALGFALAMIYARSGAGRQKRTLRMIFGERVSRATFYKLVNTSTPPNFEGEMREASVVVCEIANHGELMDRLETADYVALMNQFLRSGADFLVEQGGYLDECDGETLRVLFGVPLADEQHAALACHAALELAKRLQNLNGPCEEKWHISVDFRIGINSGEMVTAAYGSRRLGTYSVAGEPVEFARRLCEANVVYGSRILIGACTYELAASAVEVRPIELIHGPAEGSREEVYELLAEKNALSTEEQKRRDLFWKGVIYYRERRWNDALEQFRAAASSNGADRPLEFYIQRLEQLRDGAPLAAVPTGFTPVTH